MNGWRRACLAEKNSSHRVSHYRRMKHHNQQLQRKAYLAEIRLLGSSCQHLFRRSFNSSAFCRSLSFNFRLICSGNNNSPNCSKKVGFYFCTELKVPHGEASFLEITSPVPLCTKMPHLNQTVGPEFQAQPAL